MSVVLWLRLLTTVRRIVGSIPDEGEYFSSKLKFERKIIQPYRCLQQRIKTITGIMEDEIQKNENLKYKTK